MSSSTLAAYVQERQACYELFLAKLKDYGSSWRAFRPSSITDQLYIKILRIRSLEQKGQALVPQDVEEDYRALFNYSLIALIQLQLGEPQDHNWYLAPKQAQQAYEQEMQTTQTLMLAKNHDYGEAWRALRLSSLTDLILTKLLRIKQIEDEQGQTLVSEGVENNYRDIANYAIFALIKYRQSNF